MSEQTFTTGDVSQQGFLPAQVSDLAISNKLTCVQRSGIPHQSFTPKFDKIITSSFTVGSHYSYMAGWFDGTIVYVELEEARLFLNVYASSFEESQRILNHLSKDWVVPAIDEDDTIRVDFWALSNHGPRSWQRTMIVPSWKEIRLNYPRETQEELERLLYRNFTEEDGKLILWHGVPGTGKTFAIRALMREWKDFASISYIVDPEKFFSENSEYMLEILLGGSATDEKYTLLVFEDTGELLRVDAKERMQQALSRLLNVVDGLIGQGLRLLVLITTNEEINTFHPAVIRPGRCLSQMHVDKFSTIEANEWLRRHDSEKRVSEPHALAELYAILHGTFRQEEPVPTGQYA